MLARSSNPGRLGIERLFESAGMMFRCSSCLDQDVAAGCVWLRSPARPRTCTLQEHATRATCSGVGQNFHCFLVLSLKASASRSGQNTDTMT